MAIRKVNAITGRVAQEHKKPAATGSCQPAGCGHRQPRRVSATACVRAIHSAPNADFVRLASALAVRGMAAQISQIGTPSSAGQVVEGGERAVGDLGAWQRAGQCGDLVEDVGAGFLADLLLELPVAFYVLAGQGGR